MRVSGLGKIHSQNATHCTQSPEQSTIQAVVPGIALKTEPGDSCHRPLQFCLRAPVI